MLTQQTNTALIADGEALSSQINGEGFAWLTIETPSGSESAAITIQKLSGDGSTWIDAFTLEDATNRVKGLTSAEMALFGPLKIFRLKLGANVSGDKLYYCDMSD